MSNLLLDLPRELRDKIYDYVLVSETGFVEPTEVPRPQNTASPFPRFYLLVQDPRDASIHGDRLPPQETKLQRPIITLSLLRTNRQIYHETYHLFWHSNTFYFQTASDLGWTLKAMGQIPSRLIQFANLAIMHRCAPHQVKPIAKAFRLLASRARHGSFKRLQLTVSQHLIEFMGKFLRDSTIPKLNREYDEFLKVLRDGSDGCNYERTIHANMFQPTIPLNMADDWEKSVARDIHFAWGGKFYWGGLLLWEDFIEVGRGTIPKQSPSTDELARKQAFCLGGMASTT